MTPPLTRPATPDGLFLWVMHRFAEVFEEHAIIKGGIALRLLDCPRSTTDIDYVFVPFRSKKGVSDRIEAVLREIEGAEVAVALHSKMVRASVRVDSAAIQVEANVELECPAFALPTAGFATAQGQPSRLVRVMAIGCALPTSLRPGMNGACCETSTTSTSWPAGSARCPTLVFSIAGWQGWSRGCPA